MADWTVSTCMKLGHPWLVSDFLKRRTLHVKAGGVLHIEQIWCQTTMSRAKAPTDSIRSSAGLGWRMADQGTSRLVPWSAIRQPKPSELRMLSRSSIPHPWLPTSGIHCRPWLYARCLWSAEWISTMAMWLGATSKSTYRANEQACLQSQRFTYQRLW